MAPFSTNGDIFFLSSFFIFSFFISSSSSSFFYPSFAYDSLGQQLDIHTSSHQCRPKRTTGSLDSTQPASSSRLTNQASQQFHVDPKGLTKTKRATPPTFLADIRVITKEVLHKAANLRTSASVYQAQPCHSCSDCPSASFCFISYYEIKRRSHPSLLLLSRRYFSAKRILSQNGQI